MASTDIQHGIFVTESAETAPALNTISTAIIGAVVTAPDADPTMFPLDTAVSVPDISAAIGVVGKTGTAATTLQAIADQTRAPLVLVRVTEGADQSATDAAVIGGTIAGKKTGMQALLAAEAQLGLKPRIIGTPGLETLASTTALAIVAQKLRGMAYAAAIGADVAEASTYAENFSARELMLLYPDFIATGSDGNPAQSFGAARALGLRALIDQTQGWHKTISNVAVAGVTGLTKDIQFDVQDAGSEASLLNNAGITACIRSPLGFRFWGNRTRSDDANFAFESATRTAQVVMDTIVQGLMWANDKPVTPSLAKMLIEQINGLGANLVRKGQLLGFKARFNPASNPADQLAAGKLVIEYDYTPVPPLESLGLIQRITDAYLADFAAGIGS